MAKRFYFLSVFLLPVALCVLMVPAEDAQALDCVWDEAVVLELEERRIDGEVQDPLGIGSHARIHGTEYGFDFHVVREDGGPLVGPQPMRCPWPHFHPPEAP